MVSCTARRHFGRAVLVAVVALVAFTGAALAGEGSHTYDAGEQVTLWLNKVGPYHNPQETYSYYYLPFCHPEQELEPAEKFSSFGVILDGSEFINSNVLVRFRRTFVLPVAGKRCVLGAGWHRHVASVMVTAVCSRRMPCVVLGLVQRTWSARRSAAFRAWNQHSARSFRTPYVLVMHAMPCVRYAPIVALTVACCYGVLAPGVEPLLVPDVPGRSANLGHGGRGAHAPTAPARSKRTIVRAA